MGTRVGDLVGKRVGDRVGSRVGAEVGGILTLLQHPEVPEALGQLAASPAMLINLMLHIASDIVPVKALPSVAKFVSSLRESRYIGYDPTKLRSDNTKDVTFDALSQVTPIQVQ